MYKFLKKILDVDNYSVCNFDLVTYSKKGDFFLNEGVFFLENEIILGGYLDNECILNVVANDKVYWYHNFNLFLITTHLGGFLGLKTKENLRLFRDESQNYCLYDLEKKEVVQTYKAKFYGLYPSAYKNECLFIHKFPEPIIQSLSLLTGEYEWEVDLGLKDKTILHIYTVSGDILVVSYETHLYGLCGIDVHTGEVIWDIQPRGFSPHSAQTDEKKGILMNISNWFSGESESVYFEIDIQTGEYLRQGYIADMPSNVHKFVFQNGFIYFIGGRKQVFPNVLGVLDYEMLSVLWWEKPEANDQLTQIQVSESRIYVLDGEGTLHIYERNESVPFVKPTESGLRAFEDLHASPENNLPTQGTEYQDFSNLSF